MAHILEITQARYCASAKSSILLLSAAEKAQNLNLAEEALQSENFITFSAVTKEGKNKILGWIKSLL